MNKLTLCLGLMLSASTLGYAQDMPLFTFMKLGAKWEKATKETLPPVTKTFDKIDGSAVLCHAITKDGTTLYVGFGDRAAVWAYPVKKDGKPDETAGGPYAPLRISESAYDNNREAIAQRAKSPPKLAVTTLAIDPAGRIWAGTEKGIQIFDPTGRMCGVVPLPASGAVRGLEVQSGATPRILLEIDGTTWVRALK